MLTLTETQISTQYHQLNPGGDLAALVGMSKALLDMDDAGKSNGGGRALDVDFINQQTSGFEDFVAAMNLFQWGDIEACTGLTREAITAATEVYRNANASSPVTAWA